MPIDRIYNRTDPNLLRVQEAGGEQRQKGREQYPEKEKDKFDKKPPLWKRILSLESKNAPPSLLARKPRLSARRSPDLTEEEEKSLTFTERFLVLWGVLEPDGRPRPLIILLYTLILGMMVGATLLIIGVTLWQ